MNKLSDFRKKVFQCLKMLLKSQNKAPVLKYTEDVSAPLMSLPSFKKTEINNYVFHQDVNNDYNGLFRLIKDFTVTELSHLTSFPKSDYLIIQGDICAIADEEKLFKDISLDQYSFQNIIIDMSTEAINIKLDNQFFINNLKKLTDNIRQDKYKKFSFFLIHANTAEDNLTKILSRLGIIANNLTFVSIDFYLARFYLDLSASKDENIYQHYFQQIKKLADNKGIKREKYFICMNHRPRWHRYAILLFLLSYEHKEKGYVSFAGEDQGRIDAPTVDSLNFAKEIIAALPQGDKMLTSLEILNNLTPLVLDKHPTQIQDELWGKENSGHLGQALGINKDKPLAQHEFLSCYFEIVTETYFTDKSCNYITEKTLRPIISLRPFICVGTPYLLRKLKHYGFKTFSPFIDEYYDDVEDPIKRMNLILKEIDRLCSLSLEQVHELYHNLWDILEHNYFHYIENFKFDIKEKIFIPTLQQLTLQRSHTEYALSPT